MKYFFILLSVALFGPYANAQDRSRNVWCFGDSVEINFNSGAPVSVHGSAMGTQEGCTSVSDKATGRLLFYSDGSHVWNALNNIMPHNTKKLGGNFSATQSGICIPYPGSTTKYYLFSVDFQAGLLDNALNFPGDSGVSYTVIDMSLNGGLGDIAQQPRVLVTPTCEKITAAKMANNKDYWMVTHLWNSNTFLAYPVTDTGIGAPVASSIGTGVYDQGQHEGFEAIGYMKISTDGSKIAIANDYNTHTLEVFHFNNATGVISGEMLSDNTLSSYSSINQLPSGPYGISFSPNSQLLYATIDQDFGIYQYNLAAGDPTAVLASRQLIGVTDNPFALQIGPDQTIYVVNNYTNDGYTYLDRINKPNIVGTGCNFQAEAANIHYGEAIFGLPDFIENFIVGAALTYPLCSDYNTVEFTDTSLIGSSATYLWNFGDTASGLSDTSTIATPTHNFSSTGNYNVSVLINYGSDTFSIAKTVSVQSFPVLSAGNDVTICTGDSFQLLASSTSTSLHYVWTPSTGLSCDSCANPFVRPISSREYYVQGVDTFGCVGYDSVKVTVAPPQITLSASQNIMCADDSAQLCAPAGYSTYAWNEPGLTTQCIYAYGAGNYTCTATAAGGCQVPSNRITITIYPVTVVPITQSDDTLITFGFNSYQWYLNGTPVMGANSPTLIAPHTGTYTVGIIDTNGCLNFSTALHVNTAVQDIDAGMSVSVFPNPSANGAWELLADAGLAGSQLELYDANGRLVWRSVLSGDRAIIAPAVERGIYWLRISSLGASTVRKLVRL